MSREKLTKLHFVSLTFLRKLTKSMNTGLCKSLNYYYFIPEEAGDLNAYFELVLSAARKGKFLDKGSYSKSYLLTTLYKPQRFVIGISRHAV